MGDIQLFQSWGQHQQKVLISSTLISGEPSATANGNAWFQSTTTTATILSGNAQQSGNAQKSGNAQQSGNAQHAGRCTLQL
jgi:hypothetical protein